MAVATTETMQKLKFEFTSTQYMVQISPHLIIKFLYHSKMCYIDIDLQAMKDSRTQCIHGFMCTWEHSLQMTSGTLWREVTNMWRNYGITSENDNIFVLVYLL
jgi:hypothetical protein